MDGKSGIFRKKKDHDMNFLCYTARGIMIVTREEMFVLYIS